jgi:hypothetical protein
MREGLESFPTTWRRVVTDPRAFFAEMPETGGLGEPALFLALCAVINALGHLLTGWGLAGFVGVLVLQLVGAVVLAAVIVLVAQNLFEGRAGFEPTFRVVAYAWAPRVILWIPYLGVLGWLYSAYLMIRGVEHVHRIDATRALLTVATGLAVLWALFWMRTATI